MVLLVRSGSINASDGNHSVGQGAYQKAEKYRIGSKYNPVVPYLSNTIVTQPIVVEGLGHSTIISGVTAVNMGGIYGFNVASLIEVKCPRRGYKVIIRGSRFINNGKIFAYGGRGSSQASILLHTCYRQGTEKIKISDSTFVNNGFILAR